MTGGCTTCPYPSCSFQSESEHGLDIHVSRAHNQKFGKRQHFGEERRLAKRQRGSYDLPTNLGGLAPRLEVDRRTLEALKVDSDEQDAIRMSDERFAEEILCASPILEHEQTVGECHSHDPCEGEDSGGLSQKFILEVVDLLSRLHRSVGSGLVDALLRLLRDNSSAIQTLCNSVQSFSELMEFCKSRVTSDLAREGFRSVNLLCADGVQTTMYTRDVVSVLREQLLRVRTEEIITKVVESESFSHVMNAELGVTAAPIIQSAVEASEEVGVSWRTARRDGEQSFAGFLQLYSDKSVTSLKSGAFTLYPFHVTLLNLTEEARRRQIVSGRSIVAYLPVSLDGSEGLRVPIEQMKADEYRALYRVVLHTAVDRSLQPLREVCYPGFSFLDMDGAKHRMHPVVGSYCADIPEACLALSVRCGNRTARPCHRCYVFKGDMSLYNRSVPRCVADTSFCLRRQSMQVTPAIGFKPRLGKRVYPEEETNIRTALSIHNEPPVLHDFPFMELHPILDIYSAFSFEPMHNLNLGVSRLIKDCATERLRSKLHFSEAMLTSNGKKRSFSSIRSAVLGELNKFSYTALRTAFGSSLRFNVSSGRGGELRGIFGRSGLIGMLEARDMRCIDQVSPFMGAIMDRLCGDTEEAVMTQIFVGFVDILCSAYQRNTGKGWTKRSVGRLAKNISRFKKTTYERLGQFQASGMGTQKWHLLDHLCEDILRYGNLSTLDACLFEFSHGPLKGDYRGGSRRQRSAIQETIARFGDRAILRCMREEIVDGQRIDDGTSVPLGAPVLGNVRSVAAGKDGAKLSKGFLVVECFEFLMFVQDVSVTQRRLKMDGFRNHEGNNLYSLFREGMRDMHYPDFLFDFLRVADMDGLRVFARLMREIVEKRGGSTLRGDAVRMRFSNSCYVSGYPVPSLVSCRSNRSVAPILDDGRRFAQRVISKASFHGSTEPRLDDIMLEGDRKNDSDNPTDFNVWFGRVFQFVALEYPADMVKDDIIQKDGLICAANGVVTEELCFVQYYDVISEREVRCDPVDKALQCVRLKWSQCNESSEDNSASKYYGLEPIDSIRGRVHIVPATFGMDLVKPSDRRCRDLLTINTGSAPWASEMFYVNRFAEPFGAPFDVDIAGSLRS